MLGRGIAQQIKWEIFVGCLPLCAEGKAEGRTLAMKYLASVLCLPGLFTEPSGVAVNAQNDIIVADTNNHRIQIFDREGRFKFQFGDQGKRDGQLMYPNRVAVVKQTGKALIHTPLVNFSEVSHRTNLRNIF